MFPAAEIAGCTTCSAAQPTAAAPYLFVQVRLFSVIKYESVIHEFDP